MPRKGMPNARAKALIARPPVRARLAPAATIRMPTRWLGIRNPLEQPLEDQPFADEAVERWQRGQAERADEGQQGGGGQPLGQAAQPVHVAGAGGVLDHAGLQEQQGLAGAVVDHVVQRRQQQEGRERPLSVGGEGE